MYSYSHNFDSQPSFRTCGVVLFIYRRVGIVLSSVLQTAYNFDFSKQNLVCGVCRFSQWQHADIYMRGEGGMGAVRYPPNSSSKALRMATTGKADRHHRQNNRYEGGGGDLAGAKQFSLCAPQRALSTVVRNIQMTQRLVSLQLPHRLVSIKCHRD